MSPTSIMALCAIPLAYTVERWQPLKNSQKLLISKLLIRFFYPALIFGSLPLRLHPQELLQLWTLPLLGAGILGLGALVGPWLLPYAQLESPASRRSFHFICMLPNYSYLPLLLAEMLWGAQAMIYVMLTAIGADLVLWTFGIRILANTPAPAASQTTHSRLRVLWRWVRTFILQRLLNPPLVALSMGLLLLTPALADWRLTMTPALTMIAKVGSLTLPLSMFLLGSSIGSSPSGNRQTQAHRLLLVWRLVLGPGLWLGLLYGLPSLPREAAFVVILIASMPGAMVSVVLSEMMEGDAAFAARHVLWGHLCWLLTGPLLLGLARIIFS